MMPLPKPVKYTKATYIAEYIRLDILMGSMLPENLIRQEAEAAWDRFKDIRPDLLEQSKDEVN